MKVESYLFFEGRCEEAIAFYQKTLGAKVEMVMRYKDFPVSPNEQRPPEKIMHASILISDTRMMLSDGRCSGQARLCLKTTIADIFVS